MDRLSVHHCLGSWQEHHTISHYCILQGALEENDLNE